MIPFDPQVEDTAKGKVIRGRGSSDDKGQLDDLRGSLPIMERNPRVPARKHHDLLSKARKNAGSPSLIAFHEKKRQTS